MGQMSGRRANIRSRERQSQLMRLSKWLADAYWPLSIMSTAESRRMMRSRATRKMRRRRYWAAAAAASAAGMKGARGRHWRRRTGVDWRRQRGSCSVVESYRAPRGPAATCVGRPTAPASYCEHHGLLQPTTTTIPYWLPSVLLSVVDL